MFCSTPSAEADGNKVSLQLISSEILNDSFISLSFSAKAFSECFVLHRQLKLTVIK